MLPGSVRFSQNPTNVGPVFPTYVERLHCNVGFASSSGIPSPFRSRAAIQTPVGPPVVPIGNSHVGTGSVELLINAVVDVAGADAKPALVGRAQREAAADEHTGLPVPHAESRTVGAVDCRSLARDDVGPTIAVHIADRGLDARCIVPRVSERLEPKHLIAVSVLDLDLRRLTHRGPGEVCDLGRERLPCGEDVDPEVDGWRSAFRNLGGGLEWTIVGARLEAERGGENYGEARGERMAAARTCDARHTARRRIGMVGTHDRVFVLSIVAGRRRTDPCAERDVFDRATETLRSRIKCDSTPSQTAERGGRSQ